MGYLKFKFFILICKCKLTCPKELTFVTEFYLIFNYYD